MNSGVAESNKDMWEMSFLLKTNILHSGIGELRMHTSFFSDGTPASQVFSLLYQ